MQLVVTLLFVASVIMCSVHAGSKDKPHAHQGVLKPYDGRHIPYNISIEQNTKLLAGYPVTLNERSGKGGRGIVIQDVHASPAICLDRIKDLEHYHKMVPKVSKVTFYEDEALINGTRKMKAEFNVGMSLLKFRYYLDLTSEPEYNTVTWTLDYRYNSDFDDITGHWQVMAHPDKLGWSRVVYSTEVKLFPWIPEFIVTYLTKTALVESTTWVRKESEKVARSGTFLEPVDGMKHSQPDLKACFVSNEYGARYDTHCMHGVSNVFDSEAVTNGAIVGNSEL